MHFALFCPDLHRTVPIYCRVCIGLFFFWLRAVFCGICKLFKFDTQICLYFQYDWAVNIMCEPAFWLLLCAWTAPASGEVQSKVTCLALDPLLLIPSPVAASLKAGGRWVEVLQVWWSIAHLGSVLDRPHLILVAMRTRMELRIVPHQAQVQAKELSNGIQIGKYINHLFCMYVCKKKI